VPRTLALALLLFPLTALANPTADEIIQQARDAQRASNMIQTVEMVLVSKRGNERRRTYELKSRRDGEIVKSYTRFLEPADVAGTQLALVDNPDRDDEQLLYLPALKRVTRISGRSRSGAFMGSDFRYEDFEFNDDEDDTHSIAEETDTEWVIETVHADGSTFARSRTWVPKGDKVPRRVQNFDEDGEQVRELVVEEVRLLDGVTVPVRSIMTNLEKGTSTRLEVGDVRVNVPVEEIPDDMFTSAWLEQNG
jgi:outer membrane lipoprotein-sorting protein